MKKRSRVKSTASGGWRQYFSRNKDIIRYLPLALMPALAWLGQEQFLARHLVPGLFFWLGAGAAGFYFFKDQPGKIKSDKINISTEIILLAGIVIIAAGFRWWRLDGIPNGFFYDEAMNALEGLQILEDPDYLPIVGTKIGTRHPALYFYLNAVALKLGGVSILAAKMVSTGMGILTVIMFYFLARRIVSRPVALAAAVILAVMRWHVNFSRINLEGVSALFFSVAAVYFMLRGLETRNKWALAFSGLAMGLGPYSYSPFNMVVPALGIYLVLHIFWERDFLKQQWPGLLIFLGVALAAAAPLGYVAWTQSGLYFSRSQEVLLKNHIPAGQDWWGALWWNVKRTLLMFNYFGDCNGRHNIPEKPMLDSLTGLLFGLGLIRSFIIRRRHAVLALLWFAFALVPGIITIEAPQGARCIGAVVPIALLAAIGMEGIWQGVRKIVPDSKNQVWLWLGLITLLVFIGARNALDYFKHQAGHIACWSDFSAPQAAMGKLVRELGPGYHTFISSGEYLYPFIYPTILFMGYPYIEAEHFRSAAAIPAGAAQNKDLAYLLLPIHEGAVEMLRYYYPRGREQIHASPYNFNLFTSYIVTQQEVLANPGLSACYQGADGRRVERREGRRGFQFNSQELNLQYPVKASCAGSIHIPAWGDYAFRMDGTAKAAIRIGGREMGKQAVKLAQGLHAIEIKARITSNTQNASLKWQKGWDRSWVPVPGAILSPQQEIHGLRGEYWSCANWSGSIRTRRIDPFIALMGRDFNQHAPFSVRWKGSLEIQDEGEYAFGAISNEGSRIFIDGKMVVENLVQDTYQEGRIHLAPGRHSIRIDFWKSAGYFPRLVLYWTPPGKRKQKVPYSALYPE